MRRSFRLHSFSTTNNPNHFCPPRVAVLFFCVRGRVVWALISGRCDWRCPSHACMSQVQTHPETQRQANMMEGGNTNRQTRFCIFVFFLSFCWIKFFDNEKMPRFFGRIAPWDIKCCYLHSLVNYLHTLMQNKKVLSSIWCTSRGCWWRFLHVQIFVYLCFFLRLDFRGSMLHPPWQHLLLY